MLASLASWYLGGCAQPGLPLPPTLKIPNPPADLAGLRSGATVALHWTMPRRDTENVLLVGPQRAVVCRSLDSSAPCQPVATLSFPPSAAATWSDTLPPALATGAPRLLVYRVELTNRHGAFASPSNPLYTAAGDAPSAVAGLVADTSADGIGLQWQPAPAPAAACVLRLLRTRVLAPGEQATASADSARGVPQPPEQTLEVARGCTLTHTTDRDALLNRTYTYTATRVVRLSLPGHDAHEHAVEVASAGGAPVTVVARDQFPPAVPAHPEAVADTETRSIDLSWDPDIEPDLAGYVVYRRSAASTAAQPERVSGAQPLADTSWRDPHPTPGIAYRYSISAVDTSGNESARSSEVEATLTAPAAPR